MNLSFNSILRYLFKGEPQNLINIISRLYADISFYILISSEFPQLLSDASSLEQIQSR